METLLNFFICDLNVVKLWAYLIMRQECALAHISYGRAGARWSSMRTSTSDPSDVATIK